MQRAESGKWEPIRARCDSCIWSAELLQKIEENHANRRSLMAADQAFRLQAAGSNTCAAERCCQFGLPLRSCLSRSPRTQPCGADRHIYTCPMLRRPSSAAVNAFPGPLQLRLLSASLDCIDPKPARLGRRAYSVHALSYYEFAAVQASIMNRMHQSDRPESRFMIFGDSDKDWVNKITRGFPVLDAGYLNLEARHVLVSA